MHPKKLYHTVEFSGLAKTEEFPSDERTSKQKFDIFENIKKNLAKAGYVPMLIDKWAFCPKQDWWLKPEKAFIHMCNLNSFVNFKGNRFNFGMAEHIIEGEWKDHIIEEKPGAFATCDRCRTFIYRSTLIKLGIFK